MAKDSLAEYSEKRRFHATPEPAAKLATARSGPLLFVVQKHAARNLHYDLRLECDGVLLSWAVPKGPSLNRADKRFAVQTEDHPFDYASFEGIIPAKQYGAGEVIVWDCGVYSPDEGGLAFGDREEAQRRVREELARGKLSIQLRGEKLKGSFALVKMKEAGQWLLIKHKDRFASEKDVALDDRSVLSGAAVEEMKVVPARRIPAGQLIPAGKRVPMPAKLAPMLADVADAPFNKPDWVWEPKLDGYRVIASVGDDGVKLRSRKGLDMAADFPRLAVELQQQAAAGVILDGEIVAFDEGGRPSFNAMQNRSSTAVMFCFDLLYFAGIDLRDRPYHERRRYLAQCLMPSPLARLVHASDDGIELNKAAIATGFEGVIGKRKDGRYESGKRSTAWLKVKPVTTAEFVVGGYTKGKGNRAPLGALLVGHWEDGKLRYASHVGSGFDDKTLATVKARLEKLHRKTHPFAEKPVLNGPTTWVDPKAVCEVSFHSWTDDGALRAPVFVRMRDDVEAKSVRKREIVRDASNELLQQLDTPRSAFTLTLDAHRIKLSNLDRVYWPANPALKQPAITKRDLLKYFVHVAPHILRHLADRPLTMIRMPGGIGGQRFFQKHWEQERPGFVESVTVFSGHKGEEHEYLLCNNLPTLLWLAQAGTLEFHIWHSRAAPGDDAVSSKTDYSSSLEALESSILNYPDYVLFDIDPYIYSGKEAKGAEPELNTVAFEKGKEVAFRVRELLNGLKLEPIVKTSGKTGLHVFLPIERALDFDAARAVSEMVGRHLVRLHPEEVTVEWSVPKRTGKIFMDYNMNVRGKTLNVAYSPRGEPGAPVSMPLTWEELAHAHPLDFRITNAPERLARLGDRWADALERKQDLQKALKKRG
ncbi:MAG TPA: non-homologous end-joining DNA ligase [Usitatibacter sp.]|nr:non-homologous end-joining DNA ligase [Usitatibacter sp.]